MIDIKRHPINHIEFKNAQFGYDPTKMIFDNLNLNFDANKVYCLQGPTGGGKNTLIKLIMGLVGISTGEYLINHQNVTELSHKEFDLFRLNMGFAPDVGGLINNKSIFENFILPLDYHNCLDNSKKWDFIVEKLETFKIDHEKHMRPAFVSQGTRKAATLLRAFMLYPELVMLNNPTLGLNPEHRKPLMDLIQFHRKAKNLKYIILASDDEQLIEELNAEIITIQPNGQLIYQDKKRFVA